jgi:hypothetical protein
MLGRLVHERGIAPHIPVFDKSERRKDTFERADFFNAIRQKQPLGFPNFRARRDRTKAPRATRSGCAGSMTDARTLCFDPGNLLS